MDVFVDGIGVVEIVMIWVDVDFECGWIVFEYCFLIVG